MTLLSVPEVAPHATIIVLVLLIFLSLLLGAVVCLKIVLQGVYQLFQPLPREAESGYNSDRNVGDAASLIPLFFWGPDEGGRLKLSNG